MVLQPWLLVLLAMMASDVYGFQGQEEFTMIEGPKHSVILRAPRSLGNFFRRMLGKDRSSSGASAQPGLYASASSYYPSFSSGSPGAPPPSPFGPGSGFGPAGPQGPPMNPMAGPSQPFPGAGLVPGTGSPFGNFPSASSFPSFPSMAVPPMSGPPGHPGHPAAMAAAAASAYPSYAAAGGAPGTPDFHAVLDSLVRNAGISPAGAHGHPDQDVSASSITAKGDTPVFSFKKLYSFPFYLSTDNTGPSLKIPYMKQHIRRMSPNAEFERQRHQQLQHMHQLHALQQQQQLLKALQSSDMIANALQQYLKDPQSLLESGSRKQASANRISSIEPYRGTSGLSSVAESSSERPERERGVDREREIDRQRGVDRERDDRERGVNRERGDRERDRDLLDRDRDLLDRDFIRESLRERDSHRDREYENLVATTIDETLQR